MEPQHLDPADQLNHSYQEGNSLIYELTNQKERENKDEHGSPHIIDNKD